MSAPNIVPVTNAPSAENVRLGEDDRFLATAHEIAQLSGVVPALLAAHVAGADGRCRGCPSARCAAPRWPCLLRLLAEHADRAGPRRGPRG